jgi:phage terminase large subunit GpA-like protein
MPGPDKPFTGPPKKMKIVIHGQFVGTCWQYQIGVDSGKQSIMDNLRVQTPGSKYCHFPKRDDYGPAYFKGLLSEHLVYKAELKHPWCWEKIPGHERNEVLDCRNYALAAFRAMNPNLDAIERKLKMLRGVEVQQTAVVQVQPKKKSTPKKGALSRYWEEW